MKKRSFKKQFKDLKDMLDESVPYNLTISDKYMIYLDFIYEKIFNKTYLIDYIQYQFYLRNRRGRNQFLEYQKLHKLMNNCNKIEEKIKFDEKSIFNKYFSEFLGREWLNVETATFNEFNDFVKNHRRFFYKPQNGSFGLNTGVIELTENEHIEDLYRKLKDSKSIIEQIIIQSSEMERYNESSVNTLRVVTLRCADNVVRIMAAVFRTGREGKVADNFHHNGLAALIDIETGIVCSVGVDRNFKKYILHPDSQEQIVGFKIPNWNQVIEVVKKAALVIPDVRYVGWDVCLGKDNEVIIIEGNYGADCDVAQVPNQVGIWTRFKPYVEEIIKGNER